MKKFLPKYFPQLILLGLIILSYAHNLSFDFTYIDDNLIVFDEYDNINSLSKIPSAFVNGYLFDNYYRPIVMISFIIDTAIAGQSSVMYHLTNIILHIIVTLLLFKILLLLGIKQTISLIAAAFFAVHPINVSAVSWIVGRNDLLLALFSVGSIYFYILFKEDDRRVYLILSLIAYMFAMLSKEAGVLVPVIILFYEFLIRTKNGFKISQVYSLIYFAIPATIYFSLRKFVAHVAVREEIGINSFFQNIYILFEYLAKTFYFFYIDPLPVKNNTLIMIGIVTLIGLILFLIVNRKEKTINTFLFGLLMFLIIVLPTLFVRVNADDGMFNYIDCRMYLPLVGLTISLAVIFGKFSVVLKKSYKVVLVSTLFIYLISFTFLHSTVYKNGLSYWMTALEKNPERATYWMGLGYYYLDSKMYSEAIQCATTAINLKPKIGEYYLKVAFASEKAGDLEKAIEFLERGMKLENTNSVNLVQIVKICLKLGNKEKADEYATIFARLDMSDNKKKSDAFSTIAHYYSYSNHLNESISFMKEAISLAPNNPSLLNDLGLFYYKNVEIDSAKKYITEALQLDPQNNNFKKNLDIISKEIIY